MADPVQSLSAEHRQALLSIAAQSVAHGLQHGTALSVDLATQPAPLQSVRACFVTLHLRGELQGCIGTLAAIRPLAAGVARNAYTAAFDDPRGVELNESDLPLLDTHISILSEPEVLACASEEDAVSKLRPGIDGVILEENGRSGTLLPSVWESLPEPASFLRHVKLKAGLPLDYWSERLTVKRYTTESFGREPTTT
jgi:uncharacterized protein